jgi:hypothetical protein
MLHHRPQANQGGCRLTESVTGIGGRFFRARDPEGLARWYAQHLRFASTADAEGNPIDLWVPAPEELAPPSPGR